MKSTNAILFDLDGTLIDSTPAIVESFFTTYKKEGVEPPDAQAIITLIGLPLEEMFTRLGAPNERIAKMVEAYKAHYQTIFLDKTTLLPHAKEAVERASKIALLGVVTTKTTHFSKLLMEHFGLLHYFGVIIGRQEVQHSKPDPEGIEKALPELGASKKRSFMVGDTCIDMEAASRACISGIGVTTGYVPKRLLEGCATYIVEDALDAVILIEKQINKNQ